MMWVQPENDMDKTQQLKQIVDLAGPGYSEMKWKNGKKAYYPADAEITESVIRDAALSAAGTTALLQFDAQPAGVRQLFVGVARRVPPEEMVFQLADPGHDVTGRLRETCWVDVGNEAVSVRFWRYCLGLVY